MSGASPIRGLASATSLALAAGLFLAACPLTDRQFYTTVPPQPRTDDLPQQVSDLGQKVADLQRRVGQLSSALQSDAEISRRLDRLEKDLKKDSGKDLGKDLGDLRARLDATEEQSRRIPDLVQRADQAQRTAGLARSEAARVEDDLTKQLASLDRKVADLERRIQSLIVEATAAKVPPPPPESAPAAAPADRKPTAQSLYDDGYALYKSGKYPQAREKLQEYARLYPDTSLTDNAYFWIGETYYEQAQSERESSLYEKAILEYDRVIQLFPKGDKVASALLKQAFAFDAIGDPTDARILLRKLIREFSSSEQATIAKRKLDALGE